MTAVNAPVGSQQGSSAVPIVTYAVGDIHGRLDLLTPLLNQIEADAASRDAAAKIVFTGDYLDRGADSHGVVERLMAGPSRACDLFICLRGNHDDIFAKAVFGGHDIPDWARELHRHTFGSYGAAPANQAKLRHHAAYLQSLPLTHDDGVNLFVHAGIRPGVPLGEQAEHDLLWIRDPFLDYAGLLPRRVVHGHTIVGSHPVVRDNRVSIDTGAYRSGVLTAAVFDGGPVKFIQAVGAPDREAIVRETVLAASIHGWTITPDIRSALDDFMAGSIDVEELEERTRALAA